MATVALIPTVSKAVRTAGERAGRFGAENDDSCPKPRGGFAYRQTIIRMVNALQARRLHSWVAMFDHQKSKEFEKPSLGIFFKTQEGEELFGRSVRSLGIPSFHLCKVGLILLLVARVESLNGTEGDFSIESIITFYRIVDF